MWQYWWRTLLSTILKIFWTLIEWLVEQKINGAFIAFEKRLACLLARLGQSINPDRSKVAVQRERLEGGSGAYLPSNLFLLFVGETDKLVILGANQKGNSSLCAQKDWLDQQLHPAVEQKAGAKIERSSSSRDAPC